MLQQSPSFEVDALPRTPVEQTAEGGFSTPRGHIDAYSHTMGSNNNASTTSPQRPMQQQQPPASPAKLAFGGALNNSYRRVGLTPQPARVNAFGFDNQNATPPFRPPFNAAHRGSMVSVDSRSVSPPMNTIGGSANDFDPLAESAYSNGPPTGGFNAGGGTVGRRTDRPPTLNFDGISVAEYQGASQHDLCTPAMVNDTPPPFHRGPETPEKATQGRPDYYNEMGGQTPERNMSPQGGQSPGGFRGGNSFFGESIMKQRAQTQIQTNSNGNIVGGMLSAHMPPAMFGQHHHHHNPNQNPFSPYRFGNSTGAGASASHFLAGGNGHSVTANSSLTPGCAAASGTSAVVCYSQTIPASTVSTPQRSVPPTPRMNNTAAHHARNNSNNLFSQSTTTIDSSGAMLTHGASPARGTTPGRPNFMGSPSPAKARFEHPVPPSSGGVMSRLQFDDDDDDDQPPTGFASDYQLPSDPRTEVRGGSANNHHAANGPTGFLEFGEDDDDENDDSYALEMLPPGPMSRLPGPQSSDNYIVAAHEEGSNIFPPSDLPPGYAVNNSSNMQNSSVVIHDAEGDEDEYDNQGLGFGADNPGYAGLDATNNMDGVCFHSPPNLMATGTVVYEDSYNGMGGPDFNNNGSMGLRRGSNSPYSHSGRYDGPYPDAATMHSSMMPLPQAPRPSLLESLRERFAEPYEYLHYVPWNDDKETIPLHQDVNGTVWLAVKMVDGLPYCVKEVPFSTSADDSGNGGGRTDLFVVEGSNVEDEIACLVAGKDCDFIQRYFTVLENHASQTYLIQTQYCPAGSLSDVWLKRSRSCGECPSENIIKAALQQVMQALHHIHTQGFCHGNPIVVNVMVDEIGNCQLSNFGAARRVVDLTTGEALCWPPDVTPSLFCPVDGSPCNTNPFNRDVFSFTSSLLHLVWRCLQEAYNQQQHNHTDEVRMQWMQLMEQVEPPTLEEIRDAALSLGVSYSEEMLYVFRIILNEAPSTDEILEQLKPPARAWQQMADARKREVLALERKLEAKRAVVEKKKIELEHLRQTAAATAAATQRNMMAGDSPRPESCGTGSDAFRMATCGTAPSSNGRLGSVESCAVSNGGVSSSHPQATFHSTSSAGPVTATHQRFGSSALNRSLGGCNDSFVSDAMSADGATGVPVEVKYQLDNMVNDVVESGETVLSSLAQEAVRWLSEKNPQIRIANAPSSATTSLIMSPFGSGVDGDAAV